MALHSLYCADVPLRNCSLTHSLTHSLDTDYFLTCGHAQTELNISPEIIQRFNCYRVQWGLSTRKGQGHHITAAQPYKKRHLIIRTSIAFLLKMSKYNS